MSLSALPRLEVCLSPALLHLFDTRDTIVVIIDVFRATSTIATALDNGAKCVVPVATVPECLDLGRSTPNSITAGERDGKVAEGLTYGNSPFEYPRTFVEGKTLILTTTNGTRLLHMVQNADAIITGSFLNLNAVCEFLLKKRKPVLLGCAAWKDRFNLEDSLFAGAVINQLQGHYSIHCDSSKASYYLFERSQGNFLEFLKDSSHYRRLSGYGLEKDMEYCTTPDLHPVVPVYRNRELVRWDGLF